MPEQQFSDMTQVLLRSGGLYDQAEAALQRALATNPHNTKALLKLGDIYRGKGDFTAAVDMYRRLTALQPEHRLASYLSAVLSGGDLAEALAPQGAWPAPFVRMTNFLTRTECDRLLTLALAGRERFIPAGLADGDYDRETRSAWLADERTLQEIRPWFGPKLDRVVPDVLTRLQMEGLDQYEMDLQMTAHLAEGFYKTHQDNTHQRLRRRKLSYVYYFHREPKRFSGGDLLLYDTDIEANLGTTTFTRIDPLHNSIIFFPSSYFHQITPVDCDTSDFGDGRFTVNGWLRAKQEGSETGGLSAES
ncbi:MAG: 2OG-Fe(II) oxygenase [Candidatus Tectomicrobia bacterium]|nr:2OG-Fe(II) oxygenase [Candidatus Tectomicrobia bacterium]